MKTYRSALCWTALGLILFLSVPGARAAVRRPVISSGALEQIWGQVYRLEVEAESGLGPLSGAEYRLGAEQGSLFPADGSADDTRERFETYLEIHDPGERVLVRVRSSSRWSDWAEVGMTGGQADGMAGCEVMGPSPGERGWSRGPVTVECGALVAAEGGDSVEYSLGFYDWTAVNGTSFEITEEGAHWVQVRTVGADGTPGLPVTFSVALDATPPTLWTEGLAERLTHSDELKLAFGAEDQLSGVDWVIADIGGEFELQPGEVLELWGLPLGRYRMTVLAGDRAGNEVMLEETLEFDLTADFGSLAKLVRLFSARAKLDASFGLKQELLDLLQDGQAADDSGDAWAARQHLRQFVEAVRQAQSEGRIFDDAAEVLADDATWVMERLGSDGAGSNPWGEGAEEGDQTP